MQTEEFARYWFGWFGMVAVLGAHSEWNGLEGAGADAREWERSCLGTFYVKPNYPGISCLLGCFGRCCFYVVWVLCNGV